MYHVWMPAPKKPNTAAATQAAAEAARRRRDTRAAEWLRSRGWTVTPPGNTGGGDTERLNAAAEKARRLNGPMVARLRACAADTSPTWDGTVRVYPPEARGLVDLIGTLLDETDGKE